MTFDLRAIRAESPTAYVGRHSSAIGRVTNYGAQIYEKLTIQMRDGAEKRGTQQNFALSIGMDEISFLLFKN